MLLATLNQNRLQLHDFILTQVGEVTTLKTTVELQIPMLGAMVKAIDLRRISYLKSPLLESNCPN